MPQARKSSLPTGFVLVCGGDGAATLVSTLTEDGLDAVHAETPAEALSTLDSAQISLLVVVDDGRPHPEDLFGAAARRGHRLPGLYVGTEARTLPVGIEQVPTVEEVAPVVRQRLLVAAADDAESVVDDDPLPAFGRTVSHELRNHLGAARLAVESLEGPTTEQALSALDRLESLAVEAEAVASKDVGSTEPVALADAAEAAAKRLRVTNAALELDATSEVEADHDLLVLLLENLLRNAVEHGSTSNRALPDNAVEHGSTGREERSSSGNRKPLASGDSQTASGNAVEHGSTSNRASPDDADKHGRKNVTVRVVDTDSGFAVVDDGDGFGSADPFAWGYTTGEGQGAGLAIVQRVADAHGWEVSASDDDGARIEVRTR